MPLWLSFSLSKMQFGVAALISIVAIECVLTLLSLNVDLIPIQTSQTALTATETYISAFFNDAQLQHYNDHWQYLTNTSWHDPISNTTIIPRKSRKKWKYDIINYPIIPLFLKSKKKREHDMITIVTQCSLDRLYMIQIIAARWNGVISLAIYIPHNAPYIDIKRNISEFWTNIERHTPSILDVHLLFENKGEKQIIGEGYFAQLYPVNHLRNIALQCAQTEYVLLIDGDFVPSHNFMELAKKNYNDALETVDKYKTPQWKEVLSNASAANSPQIANISRNMALIIPAFELELDRSKYNMSYLKAQQSYHGSILDKLPNTKQEMVKSYRNGSSVYFHKYTSAACHASTNYRKWINPGTIAPYSITYRKSYEPYILVKRVGLHRYDARFRGYGMNKIIHLYNLNDLDHYHWMVSPDCFIYHIPHKPTKDRSLFSSSKRKRGNWLAGLKKRVYSELRAKQDATGYITA
eukprot:125026_1